MPAKQLPEPEPLLSALEEANTDGGSTGAWKGGRVKVLPKELGARVRSLKVKGISVGESVEGISVGESVEGISVGESVESVSSVCVSHSSIASLCEKPFEDDSRQRYLTFRGAEIGAAMNEGQEETGCQQ